MELILFAMETLRRIGSTFSIFTLFYPLNHVLVLYACILTLLHLLHRSDGMQPHIITVQFPSRCRISAIAVCAVESVDLSYTPHQVSVRVGTSWNDVDHVFTGQMESPDGWIVFDLRNSDGDSHFASMLQLLIESNHEAGRDSHLRCLKIYTPTPQRSPGIRMGDLR